MQLAGEQAQPSAAQALVGRVRQICLDHALGDPLVYMRVSRAMQFQRPAEDGARKQAGWMFLITAIEATARP